MDFISIFCVVYMFYCMLDTVEDMLNGTFVKTAKRRSINVIKYAWRKGGSRQDSQTLND